MYYDAHTHLNNEVLFPKRQRHVCEFMAVGGKGLICVGTDTITNARAIDIAKEGKNLFGEQCIIKATVGIHPSEISFGHLVSGTEIEKSITELEHLVSAFPVEVVALGECGMDGHYPEFEKHWLLQQHLLRAHAEAARRLQLPLVVHSRDAFVETIDILRQYTDLRIYIHCRGYGIPELQILLETFPQLRIGFCGNVTYPKAVGLRESLLYLLAHEACKQGRAHLLLETDAPWLSPQRRRGTTNLPVYLPEIYSYVSELLYQYKNKEIVLQTNKIPMNSSVPMYRDYENQSVLNKEEVSLQLLVEQGWQQLYR